jgi:hypothetical protein
MAGRRRASERAAALVLLLCLPARAHGHAETAPKRDRLELRRDGARLELEYAVPEGEEARALRRLFDLDRSGALEPAEQARLGEHLARLATLFLRLTLDGRALPLVRTGADWGLGGAGAERLVVRVTTVARAELGDGPHLLRIEDRHKDRRVVVPLTVRLQGLALEGAPLPPVPALRSDGPLELRLRPAGG